MNFKKRINGSWVDTPNYIHNTSTDTITTLPAVVYANGTTATVGLKGQTVQSSIPSPTSPVMPQGTGERTGNLVRFYQEEMQGSFYGVDVTVKNAEITLNGTVTIGSGHWVEIGYKFGGGTELTDNVVIPCEPETPYTIATEILDGNSTQVRIIVFGTSNENRTVNIGSSSTTTFSGDINRIFISLGAEGVVFNNLKFRVMFNKGSAPLPYEPYGYKIPISSANTTTPIYLGEVETTRRVKKLVFDGTENWQTATELGARIFYIPNSQIPDNKIVCTHYVVRGWNDAKNNDNSINVSFTYARQSINVHMDTYSTVSDFKTYLQQQYAAGTPVTVWYVLATPTTGIVNEPLRKIGTYADTLSNVSIPVTAGGDTISVGTTLQPSEVTVNYKGWHPVADVHERDNGAWT